MKIYVAVITLLLSVTLHAEGKGRKTASTDTYNCSTDNGAYSVFLDEQAGTATWIKPYPRPVSKVTVTNPDGKLAFGTNKGEPFPYDIVIETSKSQKKSISNPDNPQDTGAVNSFPATIQLMEGSLGMHCTH